MSEALIYRWRVSQSGESGFLRLWFDAAPKGRLHRAESGDLIAYFEDSLAPPDLLERLTGHGEHVGAEALPIVDDQIAEPGNDPLRGSAALYRWRARPGEDEPFVRGWSRGTAAIHELCQSFGARLHRAERNEWVSYARWPDEGARSRCFKEHDFKDRGFTEMRDAVEAFLSEEPLEIVRD